MVILACAVVGAGIATADPADPTDPVIPVPAGPVTPTDALAPAGVMLEDGTFTVGTDIAPGVYASAGPAEDDTCYWRRIGADDVTLNNALTSQPQLVQIEVTDVAFKTRGCQPWQLSETGIVPEQTPPWLAQLKLRHELNILNGLAGASGNGQLPPF
jgi:hypothetical protein